MNKLIQYGLIVDTEEEIPLFWLDAPLFECDWKFAKDNNLYFLGFTNEEDNAAVFCYTHDKEKRKQLYKKYY